MTTQKRCMGIIAFTLTVLNETMLSTRSVNAHADCQATNVSLFFFKMTVWVEESNQSFRSWQWAHESKQSFKSWQCEPTNIITISEADSKPTENVCVQSLF